MRALFTLFFLFSLSCVVNAYVANTEPQDSIDNFSPPPMSSSFNTPMEAPMETPPSTIGYAPGANPQIPTPQQQTGTQTRTRTTPLTVDTHFNMIDLMDDQITLQYEYFYQDAQISPYLQDAAVLANHSDEQSLQIPRYSDVIYVALYIKPAGQNSIACMPSSVGQGPRITPQSVRGDILGKVLPQVNRVEIIGSSDVNGNSLCQIVIP
jgi:hypothetical protein